MSLSQKLAGYFSLDASVNKLKGDDKEFEEGFSDLVPELKIDISDEELIDLSTSWRKTWKEYYDKELKPKQDRAEKYWLGKKEKVGDIIEGENTKPDSDNLIFEALETFLPIATSKNPEPTTIADNTIEGSRLAKKVNNVLAYQADVLKLKLVGKQVVRNWALYFLGVGKVGWSQRSNDMIIKSIRPQKLILDPEATIDVGSGEYTGQYIGEIKEDTAENLIIRFPKEAGFIKSEVQGKLGTTINYTEWWTDQMLFWRFKDRILDKVRNPHWNYDTETEREDVDEYGNVTITKVPVPGRNHFSYPRKPYIFLSIFNLGKKPHDDTSLIEQNLKQQDIIDKRQKQIDENVDNMNGGWVVSLANSGLTKDQAARMSTVLQKGGVAVIPSGSPRAAIDRIVGSGLPSDIYNSLSDARNELRGVFGITGLTPQGTQQEKTVRGKVITRTQDSSRIGGGVTEYLEQWYDQVFNWMTQMMYVYYDEMHSIPVLGKDGSEQWIELANNEFEKKLTISVKEGSLLPKDEATRSSQAIDLYGAGALDPLSLYELMDLPSPIETLKRLIMWQSNPMGLVGTPMQSSIPAEQALPEENIITPEQPNLLEQAPQMPSL